MSNFEDFLARLTNVGLSKEEATSIIHTIRSTCTTPLQEAIERVRIAQHYLNVAARRSTAAFHENNAAIEAEKNARHALEEAKKSLYHAAVTDLI